MKRFTYTKNRMIGLICCALIPAMAMGLGVLMLTRDAMINWGFAIVYFAIPLIAIGLLACCVFSNSKVWKKCVLSGVILVVFVPVFFFAVLFTGWTQVKHYEGNEAVRQYSSAKSESGMMPDLSEVGKTTKIEHYNAFFCVYIFSSETDYLICQYTQEEYENQKARLDSTYSFQTKPIIEGGSSYEPTAEIGGYQFRMLSDEDYEFHHPKNVVLIGYSDATREIVYLEYFDIDLDYIHSLKDFIIDECGWKYIR